MGDREREKGKQKRPEYEEFGESSEGSARRTRARTIESPGGEDGAGGNPSPPPLDLRDDRSRNWPRPQQRPAAQGGGEESGRGGQHTQDLISQIDRPRRVDLSGTQDLISQMDRPRPADLPWTEDPEGMGSFLAESSAAQHRESCGVGNPGTLIPPPCAGTPSSSSQMNFRRDSTLQRSYVTEMQPAATMAPQPRAQAPSSSQAQRSRSQQPDIGPSFPRTNTSDYMPQGLSMPSSGAQGGDTSRDGARGRGLQVQVRAPATAGQPGAASGALGSGQPQPRANAGAVVQCPACYNNPRGGHCLFCGRKPVSVNLVIDPRQRQPPPPPQQGLPAAPTNHAALVALQQFSRYTFGPSKPRAPDLEGQAQPSAGAGQHHFLQVPEHQRCPSCRNRLGSIKIIPRPHFCLCVFCSSSGVVCLICASGQQG